MRIHSQAGIIAAMLLLSACSGAEQGAKTAGEDRPAATPAKASTPADPYPSTYKPYPARTTLIRNVTLFDGEGGRIEHGSILLEGGRVKALGGALADLAVPEGALLIDGTGKFVTPGIIDAHSHLGAYPVPSVDAHMDGNEATDPTTPELMVEHSIWPQDPGFSRALVNGGVTALQILPGSANLIGGRTVVLKNVAARTVQGMKMPGAPYGLKMACGENPKRLYGAKGRMPSTRMGNFAVNRETWLRAKAYRDRRAGGKVQARDLGMETLADVLDGRILVHNHCYRADEMAFVIDMAKEFGYKVSAFHHAVEAYKIADLLRDNGICAAVWADWWGFKMESYDGIAENAPMLHGAGVCTIIHSDDRNQVQRLNQEAAKALADGRHMGLTIRDEEAMAWLTYNPARALGIEKETGSLREGKAADVVLWNGHPFSVYSRPEKVWIDGAMMVDVLDPARRPVSDFELGQPGGGDVK